MGSNMKLKPIFETVRIKGEKPIAMIELKKIHRHEGSNQNAYRA